jgi:N-acetylglutamate synthase-like GNAT family acetyltransferase
MTKVQIIQAKIDEHIRDIRELFEEYLSWTNSMVSREFNISFNINAILERDLARLQQFALPAGCLLLGQYETKIAGCVCLRKMGEDVGEIKRMYVRPEYRRKGIGSCLLAAVINEASQIGYSRLRLDSAPFAKEALTLYRAAGFQNIEPHLESELPEEYRANWTFMEMILNN